MPTRRQSVIESELCPFCNSPVKVELHSPQRTLTVACDCCGTYNLTGEAVDMLCARGFPTEKLAAAAYRIRRITDTSLPFFKTADLKDLIEQAALPTPTDALDGIVLWIAVHSKWPGQTTSIKYPAWGAIFGAVDRDAFNAYVMWLRSSGWVESSDPDGLASVQMRTARLTPSGWERYRHLITAGVGSRAAFMAMQFGDPEVEAVVRDFFMPAVRRAGFDLRRVVDDQGAGLIDDQMRVGIRTARFVICDLTHGNRGAYWEAGFAEGLGKPVIYTCRTDVFHDKNHINHPHFDTGHLATIPWEQIDARSAADRLTAMVRSTLPGEAKMDDL